MKHKLVTISYALLALAFPVAVLSGKLAELYLKQSNPNSIDITLKTAYAHQVMIVTLGIFGLMIVSAIVCAVTTWQSEGGKALLKKVVILSGVSIVMVCLMCVTQTRIQSVEKHYTQERLKSFWQKLSF